MPLIETKGAASAQGFGEFAKTGVATYIEDVFSTYLYTGNGSTQTITNGIDLSTKGGLVWIKSRGQAANHRINDTAAAIAGTKLAPNTTAALATEAAGLTSFNSNGFSIGSDGTINTTNALLVSWTFRKQAKFFDVVTYTGTGANRTVAHNLGSVPGCIIVKRTDTTGDWQVYHRSLANTEYIVLNSTAAKATGTTRWNSTTPTSTEFSLGTATDVNANGGTYVAYLFAHDAGGFGLTGTDNVITCGSFTTDGSGNATVTLGYEPQFVIAKASSAIAEWKLLDTMRGWVATAAGNALIRPNTTAAEITGQSDIGSPTATGIAVSGLSASTTYIYITIRRGPMKTPTSGTSVFAPITYTGNATTGTARTTGFVTDAVWSQSRQGNANPADYDRLRGSTQYLSQNQTSAETTQTGTAIGVSGFDTMNGYLAGEDQGAGSINFGTWTYVNWAFRRAPGFFDEVCYTGTGANRTVTHGLSVVPELIIVKSRGVQNWPVYSAALGANNRVRLDQTNPSQQDLTLWNNTAPTSSVFSLGTATESNQSAVNYVAYLFATCAGVSKVGSYTGTGATLQINCAFTGGARFVLIKRTNISGDWYVWDSARGIVAGNDPYLLLNSTAAEVTTTDWVDTYSAGFELSNAAGNLVNVNGNSYIFLAIA